MANCLNKVQDIKRQTVRSSVLVETSVRFTHMLFDMATSADTRAKAPLTMQPNRQLASETLEKPISLVEKQTSGP